MAPELTIRMATPADAEALLAIYSPYVQNTAVSYEYEPPSPEEFRRRITTTLATYPYLVAELRGEIAGYAYAGRFHGRKAFDWSAEVSIYVRQDLRGQQVGRQLYTALETLLKRQNVLSVIALIAYAETEDEHLTHDSPKFHERMGYRLIGRSHRCAYKFGRWYDMIWMEKELGDFPETPEPLIPLPEVNL